MMQTQENLATQLVYKADVRLLIIHADDLGVSHSEDIASIQAIENVSANSSDAMILIKKKPLHF